MLRDTWQTRTRADLFFAGQVSGVEGYVESAASGLLAGRNAAALVLGRPLSRAAAHDGDRRAGVLRLARRRGHYQPSNITHGIMAPLDSPPKDKARKKALVAERALRRSRAWHDQAFAGFAPLVDRGA